MNTYEVGQTVTFVAFDYTRTDFVMLNNYMPGKDILNKVVFQDMTISEVRRVMDDYGNGDHTQFIAKDELNRVCHIENDGYGMKAVLDSSMFNDTDMTLNEMDTELGIVDQPEGIRNSMGMFGMRDAFNQAWTIHRGIFDMDGEDSEQLEKWFFQYVEMLENHIGEKVAMVPYKIATRDRWTTILTEVIRESAMPDEEPYWCSNKEYSEAFMKVDRQRVMEIKDDFAEYGGYKGHKFKTRPNPFGDEALA